MDRRAYTRPDWAEAPRELIDAAGIVLAHHVAGDWLGVLFVIFTIAGCFGSGLAGQVSVARILYSMGRDGTLPKPLGILSKRFGTPIIAATAVSIFALLSLVLTLEQAAFMISFGALAAFAMVNLSVIRVYLFPKQGEVAERTPLGWIKYGIAPIIGFALTIWLWTSLEPATWVVGGIWFAIGLAILLAKTRFFSKPVPKMDLSEGPETHVIDAIAKEVPFK